MRVAVQAVAEDVQRRIERKAEAADVHGLEAEAAKRFAGLEAALLKGLHAVSAKTAAGLDVKVACEVRPPCCPLLRRWLCGATVAIGDAVAAMPMQLQASHALV